MPEPPRNPQKNGPPPPPPAGDVDIRRVDETDGATVDALFASVFGGPRPRASWRWLYRRTPAGPGHGVAAWSEGRMVAHAGAVLRRLRVAGRDTLCGQSIDAMTDPGWQRRGLNRALSERLFSELHAAGVEYLYGFSNENSTHGAVGYQGRVSPGPFPALLRPLRPLRLPWRLLRGGGGDPVPGAAEIPDDASDLWKRALPASAVSVVRDADYLRWRYGWPGGSYHCVPLRVGGRLAGLGVLGLRRQGRLRAAFVMESLVEADDPRLWRRLVRELIRAARALDGDVIAALGFPRTPERRALVRHGFLPLPERLSPETLTFSIRRNGGRPMEAPVLDPKAWRLRWGETDLV